MFVFPNLILNLSTNSPGLEKGGVETPIYKSLKKTDYTT